MKSLYLFLFSFLISIKLLIAQDTFSMVAADSTTREVGSAGASCVDLFAAGFTDPSFLGDLIPDKGAINTQAFYIPTNQNNARTRMLAGDTPAQIIDWLKLNDAGGNSTIRQYGIVGFSGSNVSAAGFTGVNCNNYKNHITGNINGIYYSIQGNILSGQEVLDSMESKFRNATGDLACRLMSALQGANTVGADTRCAPNGTSSLFAFVKVAQEMDMDRNPSLNISVRTRSNSRIEPIDTLQTLFTQKHSCTVNSTNKTNFNSSIKLYPNPSSGKFIVSMNTPYNSSEMPELIVYNILGEVCFNSKIIHPHSEMDVRNLSKGLYYYQIKWNNQIYQTGKYLIE